MSRLSNQGHDLGRDWPWIQIITSEIWHNNDSWILSKQCLHPQKFSKNSIMILASTLSSFNKTERARTHRTQRGFSLHTKPWHFRRSFTSRHTHHIWAWENIWSLLKKNMDYLRISNAETLYNKAIIMWNDMAIDVANHCWKDFYPMLLAWNALRESDWTSTRRSCVLFFVPWKRDGMLYLHPWVSRGKSWHSALFARNA